MRPASPRPYPQITSYLSLFTEAGSMGPCLSWAHLSSYLCMELGQQWLINRLLRFLGHLTSPKQWPAPLKLSLCSLPLKPASWGISQGSFAVWSGYSAEQPASQPRTDDQNPNTQSKCVHLDTHQKDASSVLGHVLNWTDLSYDLITRDED